MQFSLPFINHLLVLLLTTIIIKKHDFCCLKILLLQAKGGKLSFVLSSSKSEDEISETKAEDEVLAYINGAHEYVLFNQHGETESKLSISRQRVFSSLEDTGKIFDLKHLLESL